MPSEYALEQLPPRFRRLLPLIATGKTNGEIAAELFLAKHSVELYVSEILALTGARDRAALIIVVRESKR